MFLDCFNMLISKIIFFKKINYFNAFKSKTYFKNTIIITLPNTLLIRHSYQTRFTLVG